MKQLFFIIIFGLPLGASAQFPEYYAELVAGNVMISRAGKKSVKLNFKDFIYKNDMISVGNNSKLTLVNKSYRYIEVNQKGDYKIIDLDRMSKLTPATATEKYFEMVWEDFMKPASNNIDHIVRSFGGVNRGRCSMKMFPPSGMVTSTDTLKFEWSRQDTAQYYTFLLLDDSKKVLFRKTLNDTLVNSTVTSFGMKNDKTHYWTVFATYNHCGDEQLNKITIISKEKFAARVKSLSGDLDKSNLHDYYLQAAQKFLDEHFFEPAAEMMQQAALTGTR